MRSMDRRRFLLTSAAAAASLRLRAQVPSQAAPHAATLTLHPELPGAAVPHNFVGLSYETQQLSLPEFFSPRNAGLIAQFKALAPKGVLRLGGNTSDIGWWKPIPSTPRPTINVRPSGAGEPTADFAYAIEPIAITNLRGFLDVTGWTCLYGINLGTNTPARAADEAAFVYKTLGSTQQGGKLEYFQLGNEPDLFKTHLRDPKTWNADAYFGEWLAEANAIRARVPYARFGLPDTAGNPDWYATIVDRLLALHADGCPCTQSPAAACSCATGPSSPTDDRPHIAALSHHYYFGGPPSNPDVTVDRLLKPNPRVDKLAHDITAAAAKLSAGSPSPVPYRMTEGNTCFRGGKPGVSDVFAASLWAADYLLQLASFGYAGVNLHGGDAQIIANGLGGKLPGDDLVHDNPAMHPHPYYTPIAHMDGKYVAQPVYYGMMFAQQFAGAQMIKLDFDPGPVNATAFAARQPNGETLIAIVNKDSALALTVNLSTNETAMTLSAPSLDSREVTFKPVSRNAPKVGIHNVLEVPAGRAILLKIRGSETHRTQRAVS